jgi:FKBP-type peptidyl-prolyl cis-trans isomerase FklB
MSQAVAVFAVALLAFCATGFAEDAPKGDPKLEKEKISYAIGLSVGQNMKRDDLGSEVDPAVILKGLQDGLSGAKPAYSDADMRTAMMGLQARVMEKRQNAAKVSVEKNKKEGETFLAANAKKEGVKSTASGLQYKVLKEGTGETPKATDRVKTHYKGTLIDGTEFDSSIARNEPAVFPVNGVIKGWTEALQLMKVGSKYELAIPSELAYGADGAGDKIGPNATLVFEVELLSIEK